MESIIMFQQNPYNFERMFVIYRFRLLSALLRKVGIFEIRRSMLEEHHIYLLEYRKMLRLFVLFSLLLLSFSSLSSSSSSSFVWMFVVLASKSNLKAKNVSSLLGCHYTSVFMVFVAHMLWMV